MAKKDKLPLDVQSFRNAVSRFTKHGDRGTALVAAAWLDDILEDCLRAHFRPDKPVIDELFRPDGPLGSFSARIKLAYLLDLIAVAPAQDLDRIRKIRNDFAHVRGELRFTTQNIKAKCAQLHTIQACRTGGWDLRSPKQKFVVTSYFLAEYLFDAMKPKKRSDLIDYSDAYIAWIRHTVKSSSLQVIAEELDKMNVDGRASKLQMK